MDVRVSEIDSARFGFPVVVAKDVKSGDVAMLLDFCREHQARLTMVRCDSSDLGAIQQLEAVGFYLTDGLVYYGRDLDPQMPRLAPDPFRLRFAEAGDRRAVEEVAARVFDGYFNHYQTDPQLDPVAVSQVFPDWAGRFCGDDRVGRMLLAELDGAIAGFASVRRNNETEGEGVLFGVDPQFRGRNLHSMLVAASLWWCYENGCARMITSTQINNMVVQRNWIGLGLLPYCSLFTLHGWLPSGLRSTLGPELLHGQ